MCFMFGKPPHLVAKAFLEHFGIRPDSADAYAFTCIEFEKAAGRFGKLGGFAHLKTLIDKLRNDVGQNRSLLLDGGDLWQGTGLANAMRRCFPAAACFAPDIAASSRAISALARSG